MHRRMYMTGPHHVGDVGCQESPNSKDHVEGEQGVDSEVALVLLLEYHHHGVLH
jgi:hypothetical protein